MPKALIILFLITSVFSFGQNGGLDSLNLRLIDLAAERRQNYWTENRDSIFTEFEDTFIKSVTHPEFCDLEIENKQDIQNIKYKEQDRGVSLVYGMMNSINYCVSPDQRLTMFSWDDLGGGSYHSYTNYSLIKSDSLGCIVTPFEPNTYRQNQDSDWFVEVGYYEIHEVRDTTDVYYLLFGFGTYGGGKQHQSVRVFQIVDNVLVESLNSYPNQRDLTIFCNRGQELDLSFENNILKYNLYDSDNNSGFYENTFTVVNLVFEDGKFIPQP